MTKKKSRKANIKSPSVSPASRGERTSAASATMGPLWKNPWFLAFGLFVITVLAYQPAWRGLPIWDDDYHMTPTGLQSLEGLAKIWTPGGTPQYYPLVYSIFWVQYQLWGYNTLPYHLLNISLHAMSALLLWRILLRLEVPGALLAAALFALHPIQVESVAWMSELKNTLSGVFFFSVILIYLNFRLSPVRRWSLYAAAFALFLLGLMSKSVIAVLPAALLVIFWWKSGRLSWKADVLPLIPFFVVGLSSGLLTAWVEVTFVGASAKNYDFTFLERGLIAGRAIWFYLSKLAWPHPLSFLYSRWNISQAIWWQYLFPAAVIAVLAGLWRVRDKARGPLAALLLFVGILFPALGFVNVFPFRYSFVADHFQYLASAAPLTLFAAGITLMSRRMKESTGSLLSPLLAVSVLATFTTLTWRQAHMYRDIETLWKTTISRNPEAWLAYANLGARLLDKGVHDLGVSNLRTAIRIKPDYADPYNNLATFFHEQGRPDEAIPYYEKTLELEPDHMAAHFNLAALLRQLGRTDEAIVHLRKVIEFKEGDADAHRELGLAFQQKGQLPEAIVEYERVVQLRPADADIQIDLGAALLANGKTSEAIDRFQKALALKPGNVLALNNLAWVLATANPPSLRNQAKAVELAEQAKQLTRASDASILRTLAAAYASAGRVGDALAVAREALGITETTRNTALAELLRKEVALYQSGRAPF